MVHQSRFLRAIAAGRMECAAVSIPRSSAQTGHSDSGRLIPSLCKTSSDRTAFRCDRYSSCCCIHRWHRTRFVWPRSLASGETLPEAPQHLMGRNCRSDSGRHRVACFGCRRIYAAGFVALIFEFVGGPSKAIHGGVEVRGCAGVMEGLFTDCPLPSRCFSRAGPLFQVGGLPLDEYHPSLQSFCSTCNGCISEAGKGPSSKSRAESRIYRYMARLYVV